ncbi:MAG: hypothetical protein ACLU38_09715 [Dysosmobacter sp.]
MAAGVYRLRREDCSSTWSCPGRRSTHPAEEEVPPEDVEITIQEPEQPRGVWLPSLLSAAPLTKAGWRDDSAGSRLRCQLPPITLLPSRWKDSTGHIYFDAAAPRPAPCSTAAGHRRRLWRR